MVHAGTPSCCTKAWTQCWIENDEGCVISAMLFMSHKGFHLDEEVYQLIFTRNHFSYVYNYGTLASDVKNVPHIHDEKNEKLLYTCKVKTRPSCPLKQRKLVFYVTRPFHALYFQSRLHMGHCGVGLWEFTHLRMQCKWKAWLHAPQTAITK